LLVLEAVNGAPLASLLLGNFGTGLATGSFAVSNGTADGINIGVGADGDTVLTTSMTLSESSGASGTWQSGTSWLGGVVPGATAQASIGYGVSGPLILTTGGTAVTVGGFGIYGPQTTVQISSNTTLTNGSASDFFGTLDVTSGNTLSGGALQLYGPTAALTIAAGAAVALTGRSNPPLGAGGRRLERPAGCQSVRVHRLRRHSNYQRRAARGSADSGWRRRRRVHWLR
jgi:hypothetical protein